MDSSAQELLKVLLPLIPTVGVWAFVINRLVELGKAQGVIKPGEALYWVAGLNALAYLGMALAALAGYEGAVTEFAAKIEAIWPVISAAVTLAVLVAGSTGLTKLMHEAIKKLVPNQ